MIDLKEATEIVASFFQVVNNTPEELTDIKIGRDAWSLREIVGHLVDSASNNHQRFVRLQQGDLESFPRYDQELWVEAQSYNQFDWRTLRDLCVSFNRLLLHVVETASPDSLENRWITENGSYTLGWIIDDYYRHMKWHLQQFEERLCQVKG
jgi:hypothetical protein